MTFVTTIWSRIVPVLRLWILLACSALAAFPTSGYDGPSQPNFAYDGSCESSGGFDAGATLSTDGGKSATREDRVLVAKFAEFLAAKEGQVLYRGVARGSVHDIQQAAGGAIVPRGGSASPFLHVNEGITTSEFTSWTTDINVARRFAGENGVIFRIDSSQIRNQIIDATTFSRKPFEQERLIRGTVYRVGRVQ